MNKSSAGSGFTVKASIKDEESESDIDDDYDLCEETSLHSSVCLVDEYNIFKAVLASMVLCPLSSILIKLANPGIQRSNPAWYGQLTSYLTEVQGKVLSELVTLANQSVAAKERKQGLNTPSQLNVSFVFSWIF